MNTKPLASATANVGLFTAYCMMSSIFGLDKNVLKTQGIAFLGSSVIQASSHYFNKNEKNENSTNKILFEYLVPLIINAGAPAMFITSKTNFIGTAILSSLQIALNEGINYKYMDK